MFQPAQLPLYFPMHIFISIRPVSSFYIHHLTYFKIHVSVVQILPVLKDLSLYHPVLTTANRAVCSTSHITAFCLALSYLYVTILCFLSPFNCFLLFSISLKRLQNLRSQELWCLLYLALGSLTACSTAKHIVKNMFVKLKAVSLTERQ